MRSRCVYLFKMPFHADCSIVLLSIYRYVHHVISAHDVSMAPPTHTPRYAWHSCRTPHPIKQSPFYLHKIRTHTHNRRSHHIQIDLPCGRKPEAVSHRTNQASAFQWQSAQIKRTLVFALSRSIFMMFAPTTNNANNPN